MSTLTFASDPTTSPLGGIPCLKVKDLPKRYLLEELGRYYRSTPPEDIVDFDYTLWRCSETGLEFAWPMRPGNAAFYQWVSSFPSYYPGFRWEYSKVASLIGGADDNLDFRILDVGCGAGDFLRGLNSLPSSSKFGADLNAPAIEACRKAGLRAYCGTVESGMESGDLAPGSFSVVTSFHCLEHVGQPLEFVRSLTKLVHSGGRVYLSTPYSPMSIEDGWFDVLNHPPHHMTRWNLKAYQRLATLLKADMRCFAPPSRAWKRALGILYLRKFGPHANVSRAQQLKMILRNRSELMRLVRKERDREENHDFGGSDLILVELTIR